MSKACLKEELEDKGHPTTDSKAILQNAFGGEGLVGIH